ncbi:hypothetical protein [Lentilactobacillus sunkii]|uniref:Surface layer protein A domain-containing protein n=1 Tax=Lentilactobacillus sunkii DSM 19904 TaxID=1423808 RepID=A0A0R1L194_9LACO|nr:hypothetical protein [Lentilactobacillus sunkii]KRK89548.1 hypothetical protein FD17_GL001137 [Lentilactobacillus sunkii DSM 19904]
MKTKTMIATAILTAGLGIGALTTTANAASWHKGTPSALRGLYQYKLPKNSALGFGTFVRITRNKIEISQSGMSARVIKNVTYHKFGKYYHIHGHRIHMGMYNSGNENLVMYRKNNYFAFRGYKHFVTSGFYGAHYAKKTNHIKENG